MRLCHANAGCSILYCRTGMSASGRALAPRCHDSCCDCTQWDNVRRQQPGFRAWQVAISRALPLCTYRRRGIWVMPALLNHSCAPTTNITWVDDAAFVRAARALDAGASS